MGLVVKTVKLTMMNAWPISVLITQLVLTKSIPTNAVVCPAIQAAGVRTTSMNVTQVHVKTQYPVKMISMISNVAATKVTKENGVKNAKSRLIATLVMVVVWVVLFSTLLEHSRTEKSINYTGI